MRIIEALQDLRTLFRVWMISGAVTVFVPLISFVAARASNNQENNNNGGGSADQNQNQYYYNGNQNNDCHWYNWGCSNQNQYNNNQGSADNRQEESAPWWWFGAGEDRRRDEFRANPALVFAYVWSLSVFVALLHFGFQGVRNGHSKVVIVALLMFANLAFLLMVLLQGVEGIVEVDGPELEENGFCGQMGVLMFLTCFFWLLFSVLFAFLLRRREQSSNVTTIEIEPSDYRMQTDSPTKEGPSEFS